MSAPREWIDRIRRVIYTPIALTVATSLVAVAVIGALVITITPLGCRVGLHGAGQNCQSPVAAVVSPSPTHFDRSPTPSWSPYPSPSPIPMPSPSPLPALPPYGFRATDVPPPWMIMGSGAYPPTIALNCRLPIYVGQAGSGGFIAFPGGTYIADPRSAVGLPPPPAGYTPPPYMGPVNSANGLTYVQAYDKWLPVDHRWVTPDGSKYAYTYFGAAGIYVADVGTGHTTELGADRVWNFVGIDSNAVYAAVTAAVGQPSAGLWRLPFSGDASQIVGTGYWQAVGGGAAYGTATSAVPQGVANVIVRMDLKTGATEPWFMAEDATSMVVGFDRTGLPLIQSAVNKPSVGANYTSLWLVSGVGKAEMIAASGYGVYTGANLNWNNFVSDQHGLWFGGGAIYLVVIRQGAFTMSTYSGALAGPCR